MKKQNKKKGKLFFLGRKCVLKIFKHYDDFKIIIVSLIGNLQKGASGQAVQCFNLSKGFDESSGLI